MLLPTLNTWFEDGTPKEIARALGDVARSKGMSDIARFTGLIAKRFTKMVIPRWKRSPPFYPASA